MTDRRAFIGGVAGVLLASPHTPFAQQLTKVPRIGILGNTEGTAWEAFRRGLRELGYVDGRNVTIDWRWADGKADRYPALATEFVRLKADVIVTSSTPAALAAKRETSWIPIVMVACAYPDKIGLVESLARPGGNVTGMSNVSPELQGERLLLLKEMAPKASRMAVLWNPSDPVEVLSFREQLPIAAALGIEIRSIEVRRSDDHAAAFVTVTASRADALHAVGNPVNFKNARPIADYALTRRLPSSFEEKAFVEGGGLFSYAPNLIDLYGRAAAYVDKILKGAQPADLPIEPPSKFEFAINLKTAKALGLTISNSLLLRADEIIE